jgi:hypothetical protein
MNRTLGHPARWLDLAFAVESVENRFNCSVELALYTKVETGKNIGVTATVTLRSRALEPSHRAKRIERHTFRWLGSGYSFTEQMYVTLWECYVTAEIVWPAVPPTLSE